MYFTSPTNPHTLDDFGTTGDDTIHSAIPYYPQPQYDQAESGFPSNVTTPAAVDLIFLDYFASNIVPILNGLGGAYTEADVSYYLDPTLFTTQTYLPEYAKMAWQGSPFPNCPIGSGFGTR